MAAISPVEHGYWPLLPNTLSMNNSKTCNQHTNRTGNTTVQEPKPYGKHQDACMRAVMVLAKQLLMQLLVSRDNQCVTPTLPM